MPWKRVVGIVLVLACLFVFLFPSQQGYANVFDYSSLNDGWVDPYALLFNFHDVGGGVGEKPLFLKYSILNYWFEYDLLWVKIPGLGSVYVISNVLLSIMMLLMGGTCLIVISLADWAFNYQGLDPLADYVEKFVEALRDQLFLGELFGVMIFFLGVTLIFAFGRNEDVAGKLIKVIINLVIAFTLMANMSSIIRGINGIGKLGSEAVFGAFSLMPGVETTEYTQDKSRNAMLNVYDGFFKYNFYKPWQLANYGLIVPERNNNLNAMQQQVKKDTDEHLEGNIVQKFLFSPIDNVFKNLAAMGKSILNTLLPESLELDEGLGGYGYITTTPLGIPFRFFIVMLTFVIGSAYGLLLLAIAGTTIFGKLIMLFLAMLAPLVFLFVLIPEWGDTVLMDWAKAMIAAGTYWIFASLMLVMILFMQYQLYEISDSWVIAMFLQCILLFTVFRFRNHIMEFIPISQMAMMNAAETAFFEKGKEAVDKTKEMAIEGGTFLAIGGAAVATGNPAMLSSLGRSKLGSVGKGILENAATMRRDAAAKGEKKPGMTKALRSAVKKQFGSNRQRQQQMQQQTQRTQQTQHASQNEKDGKQSEKMGGSDIESATKRVAAALNQLASDVERIRPSGKGEVYTEVGNRAVNYQHGEYAVLDQNNKKVYSMKDGEIRDTRSNSVIGKVQNDRIISPSSGAEIGRIQNGQLQIQVPTAQSTQSLATGKIYAQSTSQTVSTQPVGGQTVGGPKIIQPEVIIDPKVKVLNPNPEVTIDPKVNAPRTIDISPEMNVKGKRIDISPDFQVNQAEKINVKPEFNIENSKVDLDVTTNVTQHNTITGGGGSGFSSSSNNPPPQPQPINLNVQTSGSGAPNVNQTNQFYGDTVQVNADNGGDDSHSTSNQSGQQDWLVRLATGQTVSKEEQQEALQKLEKENKKKGKEEKGGFWKRLLGGKKS